MEKYFKRSEKDTSSKKQEHLEKKAEQVDNSSKKKGSAEYRSGKVLGYTNSNTLERIKSMQLRPPKGDWRKFDTIKIKITTLIQKWTHV